MQSRNANRIQKLEVRSQNTGVAVAYFAEAATKARPATAKRCLSVSIFILLFSAGCAREQRAVELYVDAVMLDELNEQDKAVEKLNTAVQVNKRFSLAYSLLGDIYQKAKNYEKSAASYEKATELNPWSFGDYFNLGRDYQIMEKFTLAVKAYAKACELKPGHLDSHINAAKCYYEIKDFNSALVYGERARKIDPNVSEVQKILGDIHGVQKDYDQAIACYKRALEIDSNNAAIMVSLAVAYLRSNNNEPAKELLTSAMQIQPDNNAAYQYLGYCYLRLREQAAEAYKQLGEADSNAPARKVSLDEYIDKAIESYGRAIEINNKDWEAFRGLGVAYMLRAIDNNDELMKEKAVQQWRMSLDIKPDQPRRERLLELTRKYSKKDK
jgi:tetratricopeptide (TPR) repeat protein